MYNRLRKLPLTKQVCLFLFEPRGTGKTHWVRQHLSNAIYIDLLQFDVYKDLLANPGRLEQFIPKSFSDWIVIDEVH